MGHKDFLIQMFNEYLTTISEKEDMNKFVNNIPQVYKNVFLLMAEEKFEDVCSKVDNKYLEIKKEDNKHFNHLEDIWGEAFKLSICFYDMIAECLESYPQILNTEHTNELISNRHKLTVLELLSRESLSTFKSVFILVKNGMGDDAYKLCRNLYENWVISTFIYQNNESTAEAFLGSKDDDVYGKSNYEWARKSGCFTAKENISFKSIFDKCDFEETYASHWHNEYKRECKFLHITPQGITHSFCLPPDFQGDFYLIGNSPYGLNIAAEHSAIYLFNIVKLYFCLFVNEWETLCVMVMQKMLDKLQSTYSEIADKLNTRTLHLDTDENP